MPRPDAIYLETSFLWTLPIDLEHARFLNLKERAANLRIPLFTVRLCVDEYLFDKAGEIEVGLHQLEARIKDVAPYVLEPPKISLPPDVEAIVAELEPRVLSSLTRHGVEVVANAEVPQDTLVMMSVRKTRPFEEKREKGFRDTIILYSVLEHAKACGFDSIVLVALDKVFGHSDVQAIAEGLGVTLNVAQTPEEAVAVLEEFQSKELVVWLARRKSILAKFLRSQSDVILAYVRNNVQIEEYSLTQKFGPLDLREIRSIELADVDRVLPGFLPPEKEEGQVRIGFDVRLRVEFLGKPFPTLSQPRVPLREGATREDAMAASILNSMFLSRVRSVADDVAEYVAEPRLFFAASVRLARRDDEEEYTDLAIESAKPPGVVSSLLKGLMATQ